MHKICQDSSQQSSTFNVHSHASDLETDNSARKKDRQEFDKLQQEEKEEIYTKPAELNSSTAKYMISPGSVREYGLSREVHDDVKQEDTNQHFLDRSLQLGTQHAGKLSESFDPSDGDGEEILLESDSSKLVKNITFQSSPFNSRSLIIIFWDKMNKVKASFLKLISFFDDIIYTST